MDGEGSSKLDGGGSSSSVVLGNPKDSSSTNQDNDDNEKRTVIKQVKALYDYEPEDPGNELAMNEGDVIDVYEMEEENGWWMGGCNGFHGFFPSNFVTDDLEAEIGGEEEAEAEESEVVEVIDTVDALYDYAGETGELSFSEGDKISVFAKGEDGWWEGEVNGKRGVFPSNYTSGNAEE